MRTRFVMLEDSTLNETRKGTIVYSAKGYDYGCASEDTKHTGVEHISVTLKPDGDYPFFTVPLQKLKNLD